MGSAVPLGVIRETLSVSAATSEAVALAIVAEADMLIGAVVTLKPEITVFLKNFLIRPEPDAITLAPETGIDAWVTSPRTPNTFDAGRLTSTLQMPRPKVPA